MTGPLFLPRPGARVLVTVAATVVRPHARDCHAGAIVRIDDDPATEVFIRLDHLAPPPGNGGVTP